MARLPGRTFTPPVAVKRDIPRVVRDDSVRVAPVDLAVEVHVGVGQAPLTKGIIAKIAKIGVGQRCRCRIFVQHVSARGDELVRRVVLVGECAAEAGAGLADGATEGVFVGTRPARRGEAFEAFDRF